MVAKYPMPKAAEFIAAAAPPPPKRERIIIFQVRMPESMHADLKDLVTGHRSMHDIVIAGVWAQIEAEKAERGKS